MCDIAHIFKHNKKVYLQSNKKVLKVDPKMVRGKEDAWMVRIEDVHTKVQEELEFDIVVVCNG